MTAREEAQELLAELQTIGPVLPGKVSEQYNVCGKPGCRCKDPDNPQRHGPYYQLSYTLCGKSSTRAVSQENLEAIQAMTDRWGRLKTLERDLAVSCLAVLREEGPNALQTIVAESADQKRLNEQAAKIIELEKRLLELEEQRDRWKSRAAEHADKLGSLRAKVRDLSKSRDSWKAKAKKNSEVSGLAQKKSTS